jgi:argininosuccinate lyase
MKSKVSGFLSQGLDPLLQREMVAPGLRRNFAAVFPLITMINKAHVLMLARQAIITADVARKLAQAILDMERAGPAAITPDPAREEEYFNYEARLIELTGSDVGGRSHIARSRNDLKATKDRLRARPLALAIYDGVIALRAALLEQAERHRDVVMPGYTHLQPAQPITFGYYLLGVAQALERDHARLAECWPRLNVNPLGTGALAGTSFPIDRALTTRLLGFDAVAPHAQDAVASRDYLVELIGSCALAASTWGRMAQDFYVMTTWEFATLELPDSIAVTSSIMPQKKNMVALETLKSHAASLMGAWTTAMAGIKGTTFTLTVDSCLDALRWVWDALEDTRANLAIATLVAGAARPRAERMRELARANFATATDLADALVLEGGLSFRDAHHLTGAVVRAAMDRGLTADRIDASLVAEQSQAMLGRRIALDPEIVRRAVDPATSVEIRRHTAGPSSEDMRALIARLRQQLDADRREARDRRRLVDQAAAQLDAEFRSLLA